LAYTPWFVSLCRFANRHVRTRTSASPTQKRRIALVNVNGLLISSSLAPGNLAAYALDEDIRKEVDIKVFNYRRAPSYEKYGREVLGYEPFPS